MKPKLSARQDLYSCEHTVNVRSGESQKGFKKKTRKQIGWRLIEEKAREEKIARNFLLLPRIPAARLPKETAGQRPDLRHHQSMLVDGNKSRPGRTWCKDRRYRMKSGQETCGDNVPPLRLHTQKHPGVRIQHPWKRQNEVGKATAFDESEKQWKKKREKKSN